MILEHAIYDVYNYLIQRKSIKKDEVQSGARSLSISFFGLQVDRLANMTNHYAFIKIKLTIMGLFLKILSKNVSLIVLLLISHLLDRSFSNMLSLLNLRTQLQYSF